MRRLSALLEAVECEKIRKLSVELGLKNATEMRVGLAFLQACRMRVTMKNAYAAFSRGDCAKALELYGAVLPLTTANRRQHLERYRASCLRVKQTRLRLKP